MHGSMVERGPVIGKLGGTICTKPARLPWVAACACLYGGSDDRRDRQLCLGTIVHWYGFVIRKGVRPGSFGGRGLVKYSGWGLGGLW